MFSKSHRHVTAEMIHAEATQAKIRVSLATIYNTLHLFTEAGLLRQIAVDASKAHFDTNNSDHHQKYPEEDHVPLRRLDFFTMLKQQRQD